MVTIAIMKIAMSQNMRTSRTTRRSYGNLLLISMRQGVVIPQSVMNLHSKKYARSLAGDKVNK